jgi:hypothetical protein
VTVTVTGAGKLAAGTGRIATSELDATQPGPGVRAAVRLGDRR